MDGRVRDGREGRFFILFIFDMAEFCRHVREGQSKGAWELDGPLAAMLIQRVLEIRGTLAGMCARTHARMHVHV